MEQLKIQEAQVKESKKAVEKAEAAKIKADKDAA